MRSRFFHSVAEILRETWRHMLQARLFLTASSLAYTTILSIIPLLAMSFAFFKAFGGMEKVLETLQPYILENLAEGVSDEVLLRLEELIGSAQTSVVGVGGFLGLVLTSMSMLASAEKAINQVWDTEINRGWFQRISSYWLFITLGPIALSVALGAATSKDYPVWKLLPSGTGSFILTVGVFYAVYKYVPNRRVDWRYALLSSLITSMFWNLARLGYAAYTENVVTYHKIYGSLGAIPILLLWIYIIWIVVLVGAAFTAALQKVLGPSPQNQ